MNSLFYQLARLSLIAGWMTLLLLALRPLLKKLPRRFSCLLWGLVAVRLMLPFTLESRVSLVPKRIAAPSQMLGSDPLQGLPAGELLTPAADTGIQWQTVLPVIWVIGTLCMLAYALISCILLARQVKISMRTEAGVYLCDNIRSPFVLGIAKPKIYLPSDLEPAITASVLAHERAHLRRGDHLWKPLGFLLLSIYWFNPACWLAYVLFCRDMEQACDESVIQNMDSTEKKRYSAALLACSVKRSAVTACSLSFGEVGVKTRIRNILRYREPKFWGIPGAVLLCIVLSVCLLTDPVKAASTAEPASPGEDYVYYRASQSKTLYASPEVTADIVTVLPADCPVKVILSGTIDGAPWAFIQYDTDEPVTGWIQYGSSDAAASVPSTTLTLAEDTAICQEPAEYSQTVAALKAGTTVTVLRFDESGDISWACVTDDSGHEGWIKYDSTAANISLSKADPQGTPYTLIRDTVGYLSPTEDAKEVASLSAGTDVVIQRVELINNQQWAYVQIPDLTVSTWIEFDGDYDG